MLLRDAGNDLETVACLEVEPVELERAADEVPLRAGREKLVVEVAAVGRDRRPRGAAHVLVDELDAASTFTVIHPDAARARPFQGLPTHDDVVAVGHPGRLEDADVQIVEHLTGIRAVGVHHPEIILPASVGNERDRGSVWRDARMKVERDTAIGRQALGLATFDGQAVDVRQQVENEVGAVRRHIDRHERAFVNLEVDLMSLTASESDIPVIIGILCGRRSRQERHGRHHPNDAHCEPPD